MTQQRQVFPLKSGSANRIRWAYRYRVGGRGSRRVQRGGYESEQAASEALERALARLRREQGLVYLAQHDGEPETVEKLRWLLDKAVRSFGDRRISQLRSPAIAAWRMSIPAGHRFEATQALRHNFRTRYWRPAQVAAVVTPLRRVYDLRHTFATFALRAGISLSTSPATWARA
jgi:integrase